MSSALVKQKYDVWLKVEFPGALRKFRLEAVVEHNRGALPYLVNGKNAVTVAAGQECAAQGGARDGDLHLPGSDGGQPRERNRFDGSGLTYGPVKP